MLLLGGRECGFLNSLHSSASFLSPKKTLAPPSQLHRLCLTEETIVPTTMISTYCPE